MCKFLHIIAFMALFSMLLLSVECKKNSDDSADEKWKKKAVTDYSDADLERLFEQWEDNDDEELEEDELPEWKRPQPKIDLSKINPDDPESMLKATKKGKTLMMFATVAGNPEESETETISQLWQSSLHNANVDVQRYVVGANRVLFVVRDGPLAWEVRDFLLTQDNCEVVTIEGKDYVNENVKNAKKDSNSTKRKDQKKKKPNKDKLTEEDKKKKQNIENEIKKNFNRDEL